MSKKLTVVEEVDWIIFRLLHHAIRAYGIHGSAFRQVDFVNALMYLREKYTDKTVRKAIDAMHCEYGVLP